ncbi:MAG: DUF937 domain-containing protein [Paludibacteraceae bacterium]
MNLSDLISGPLGQSIIKNVAGQLGVDESQASSAIGAAIPVILGGMGKNTQTQEGAVSLNNALETKHDGSLLDNLSGMLSNNASDLQQDGDGILNHVFGSNKDLVESGLSQKTGISMAKIGPLLAMLAPVVMAYLGKEKKENNVNAGGLNDLLGGMLGGGGTQQRSGGGGIMDMVSGFLDKDKDGSALDDLFDMFTKR